MKFGEAQADHYTDALEVFFETLAGMPDMGRDYHAVPGVMRIEFQRHTIFYTVRDTDILIARFAWHDPGGFRAEGQSERGLQRGCYGV
ncbi:type II toxin-antitoxin system RelE/ParE family toxin [Xenorhabdus bovienii]|uniref:type II toxin-antitoxin system RelE/ParE family toxin n=1 Tax=Xenorhabdus bovienii TaxID=40576 RepID=UPI0023B282F0|nr:type II toxin-antitoxin system RelE/ParE family toxin [Xenorhabdus bovienii]